MVAAHYAYMHECLVTCWRAGLLLMERGLPLQGFSNGGEASESALQDVVASSSEVVESMAEASIYLADGSLDTKLLQLDTCSIRYDFGLPLAVDAYELGCSPHPHRASHIHRLRAPSLCLARSDERASCNLLRVTCHCDILPAGTSNDCSIRDPVRWRILASNDGKEWLQVKAYTDRRPRDCEWCV